MNGVKGFSCLHGAEKGKVLQRIVELMTAGIHLTISTSSMSYEDVMHHELSSRSILTDSAVLTTSLTSVTHQGNPKFKKDFEKVYLSRHFMSPIRPTLFVPKKVRLTILKLS
ncbi:hypothetical protein NPIL_483261 [Nephila pilipes]|uniref:Uncharacterized protein n=1 Tax=Nephila pilipes TaxID=299642 RepID=A0A8X6PGJ2_NEPPI|nr:hypothetical protein NPIL_483261 [Nephila pilipes]